MQPVAIAGATLQAIWLDGQFHGVMNPHTPIGSLVIMVSPRRSSNWKFSRIAIAVCRCPMPMGAWAFCASQLGAPISSVIASERSLKRFSYSLTIAFRRSRRSSRLVWEKLLKA